jgi:hypothetical protein
VYETYSGDVVATIDACGPACAAPDHKLHAPVRLSQPGVLPAGVLDHAGPPGAM